MASTAFQSRPVPLAVSDRLAWAWGTMRRMPVLRMKAPASICSAFDAQFRGAVLTRLVDAQAGLQPTTKDGGVRQVESGKALLDLYGRGQIGQGDVATCGTGRGEPEIEIDLAGQFRIHLIVHLAAAGGHRQEKVAMKERKIQRAKGERPRYRR